MSTRDKRLLQLANLDVKTLKPLLDRSQQAIYQGIAGESHYFKKAEVLIMTLYVKRYDPNFLSSWLKFLESQSLIELRFIQELCPELKT